MFCPGSPPDRTPPASRLVAPETVPGHLAKTGIGQLTALVKTRLRRMQYRPGLLDGFLAKTGLDLSNFHN